MKKIIYPLFILLFFSSYNNPCSAGDLNLKTAADNKGSAVLIQMSLCRIYQNKTVAVDGTITEYGDNYSNNIDRYDARKMMSPGENISLYRHDTDLVIERRKTILSTDTIFFRMWGIQQTNYRLQIVPSNLNTGITAYLIDNYLHTSQELNLSDTTKIPFTVNNDPASYDQFRFKIIFSAFKKLTSIPFSFISLGAVKEFNNVHIQWQTADETNMANYQVERSADQVNYKPIATVNAANSTSNTYEWTDRNPLTETSFYRIHSVSADGSATYSEVLKVKSPIVTRGISIYPNPVMGNSVNLKLNNQGAGIYKVNIYNAFGSVVLSNEFNCSTPNSLVKIPVNKSISKGIYYLEVIMPFGMKESMNIVF